MGTTETYEKNRTLRWAGIALLFTLISASLLFGTLSKYTTALTGTDTARVAAWGFNGTFTGADGTATFNLFSDTYKASNGTIVTVDSLDEDKVIAPGTSGTLGINFTGQSEVMTEIKYAFTATYSEINATSVGGTATEQVPLVYKVTTDAGTKYYSDYYTGTVYLKFGETSNVESVTIVGNLAAMATALNADTATIAANTPYSGYNETITWYWAYEQYDDATGTTLNTQRDKIDTFLGEKIAATMNGTKNGYDGTYGVTLKVDVTATQVD